MAVCRWLRDNSQRANLGQAVGRGLSARGRARKSHRYHECASRLPARKRRWRLSALGWTRTRASPGRRGRWNRTTGGASSIWPHSGLVAMARACAMARPASPGCPPASGVQRAQAVGGVAGGKRPRCPDSFPTDLFLPCFQLHVQCRRLVSP